MELTLPIILEVIGTVGFPILVALALGYFVYLLWKQSAEREDKLLEALAESRRINSEFTEIISKYNSELTEIKTDIRDIKTTIIAKEDSTQ